MSFQIVKSRKPAKPQFPSQEKPRLIQNQIGSPSRGDKENTDFVGKFVETDDFAGIFKHAKET